MINMTINDKLKENIGKEFQLQRLIEDFGTPSISYMQDKIIGFKANNQYGMIYTFNPDTNLYKLSDYFIFNRGDE